MEWYVEWDFQVTRWGKKPMQMKRFATESEAIMFAEFETTDGEIGWEEQTE